MRKRPTDGFKVFWIKQLKKWTFYALRYKD